MAAKTTARHSKAVTRLGAGKGCCDRRKKSDQLPPLPYRIASLPKIRAARAIETAAYRAVDTITISVVSKVAAPEKTSRASRTTFTSGTTASGTVSSKVGDRLNK